MCIRDRLVSQLAAFGYDEAALLEELRARRPGETGRGLSLFGPQRDDLKFLEVDAGEAATGLEGDEAADAGGSAVSAAAVVGPACGPVDLPRGGRDLRLSLIHISEPTRLGMISY